jgi:hypothetical protein
MHPLQDLFLESFSYELQLDMHSYLHKNFILAKSGCYKEEPFVIEVVVLESPTAQDSPAEEQQQPKDHDVEDKANEEYLPPSDTEDEKMH